MIKWPAVPFLKINTNKNKKNKQNDSILPISYDTASRNQTFFAYIYDASAGITTAITESCQVKKTGPFTI